MTGETTDHALVQQAIAVSASAYVPYSHYRVGAALKTTSGRVFTGANVENASYPASICAERSAVVQAVSAGARDFDTIAVVTRNAGTPCGICRQVLAEFGLDTRVLIADMDGVIHEVTTVGGLLPGAFLGSKLAE